MVQLMNDGPMHDTYEGLGMSRPLVQGVVQISLKGKDAVWERQSCPVLARDGHTSGAQIRLGYDD